jgi:flagellar basal body rod protein FlgC
MIGAISNALSGLMAASKKAEGAAVNIANAGAPGREVDLAEEAVTLKMASITYKANIGVLKTAEEMSEELGRVFDEKV